MKKILLTLLILSTIAHYSFSQELKFQPPWNNPPKSAVEFTVAGIDNVPDLYGEIENPQLVVFFAGNQFMVIEELITAFKEEHPQYERIFVETLPPGILAEQVKGGSLTIGNLKITHKPDIYTAGEGRITEMKDYFSETKLYAKNKLSLMVQQGNPKNIKGLQDLKNAQLQISMPNPAWEGVGEQIKKAYVKAGGEDLLNTVMDTKVADGTTYLTKIHHRQSPLRILNKLSDVAPVWHSEVVFQKLLNHPVEEIHIPDEQNITANYFAGVLKEAPHPEAAKDFISFLTSEKGKSIYQKYGFMTQF
ncbi:MAG TPA: substrate-binding domain-containing protein [Sphingobacterium sp.]|nr:substrate-binding domain-containing protein [Sphingobacterium sp.]